MSEKVKISIVVATYNSAATLERALRSVEEQEFQDWECLVMDGASKDGTVEIAECFASRDKRFQVHSEPDSGIYDAFNKGWKKARGEFMYYLGSDDELLPGGLKALAENSEGVDYVYGGVKLRFRSGRLKVQMPRVLEEVAPVSTAACHQGVIMRRSLIERLGGFNTKYRVIADADITIHGFLEGMKTRRITDLIAIFNVGGTSTDSNVGLREKCEILRSYGIEERVIKRYYRRMAFRHFLLRIKHRFD